QNQFINKKNENLNQFVTENENVTQGIWPVIVAEVGIISKVVDGRYLQVTTYEDGKPIKTVTTCTGTFGTCSISSSLINEEGDSETNLSIDPILIEESDTEAYTVHAEIMNSDIGVLYAINYLEYPEDAELFFGDDTKIITGDVKI